MTVYRNITPTEITALSLSGAATIQYDRMSYMTSEFGRFATIDRVPLVQAFFERAGNLGLPPGEYTRQEMQNILGLGNDALSFSLRASTTNILGGGYAADAYVWNNTAYTIGATDGVPDANAAARFIVGAEGLSIQGFQVRARNDNFDTQSTEFRVESPSLWAPAAVQGAANAYIDYMLSDFGNAGRVNMQFVGDAPVWNLSQSDYQAHRAATLVLDSRDGLSKAGWYVTAPLAILRLDELLRGVRADLNMAVTDDIRQGKLDAALRLMPCFCAGTKVLLADYSSRAIENIDVGDLVAAFDQDEAGGRGQTHTARVIRLKQGVTTAWILLALDGTTIRATLDHPFLTEHGTFAPARDLMDGKTRIVAADGSLVSVCGTLLRATDAGSDATWIESDPIDVGGVLVKQAPVLGWRTYNLTVEKYHTYIAGGCRVHNDCLLDGEELLPASLRFDIGGYSIDVINSTTGLVTTIDHTYAPDTGQEFLSRRTFIPGTEAYLSASWGTFDDAYQPIGPAAYTVNWAGGTQTLGPLPDGVTVAPGRAVVAGQEFGTLNIVDPATSQVLQSVGVAGSPTNPADAFLMTAQYDTSGEFAWSQSAQVIDTAGTVVRTQATTDDGTTVTRTREAGAPADDPDPWAHTVKLPDGTEIAGGEIGSILGSSIGNAIAGGNVFAQIAASSVLGTRVAPKSSQSGCNA